MRQKNQVVPLELTSVDATAIAIDSWTAFEPIGIEGACFFIRITNYSDVDVFISFDGSDQHEFIPAEDSIAVNFQTNSSPSGYESKLPLWSVLYVQGHASQKGGDIYLSGFYNQTY